MPNGLRNGIRIREARKRKGLTQIALGDLIGADGNLISRWETDKVIPSNPYVVKLAETLDVSSAYLLGETDSPDRVASIATSAKPEPQIVSNARFADDEMEWVSVVSNDVKVCCGAGNVYPDEVIWEETGKYPIPTSVLIGYAWQVGDGGFHIISVEGDSMEPRVPNGSKILIADIHPINGDLAVALYKGRILLRGVLFEKERIRLQAWNKEYEDIVVRDDELDDLCFLGKMLGIVPEFDHLSSMW